MTNLLIKLFIKNKNNRVSYGYLSGITGICCNVVLFISKLILGYFSGSIAIISDGFNNLSDSFSAVITLVMYKMASKPADKSHPFGHGRMEYLASLIIAVLMLLVGFEFCITSFGRIQNPIAISSSQVLFVALVLSVLLKLWLYVFNSQLSKLITSTTLKATAKDSLMDALTTSITLLAVVLAPYTSLPIDGYVGLLVSLLILKNGIEIIRDTVDHLLGHSGDEKMVNEIMEFVMRSPTILGIHDLVVHDYGPGNVMASFDVEVDARRTLLDVHQEIDTIERELFEKMQIRASIHTDPIEVDNPEVNSKRLLIGSFISSYDKRIGMHDFRLFKSEGITTLKFDLVVPHELLGKEQEIYEYISKRLEEEHPDHQLHINFETDYNER